MEKDLKNFSRSGITNIKFKKGSRFSDDLKQFAKDKLNEVEVTTYKIETEDKDLFSCTFYGIFYQEVEEDGE